MTNIPKIRKAEKKDLNKIVALCQLHATYEKAAYDPDHKEESLRNHLFSTLPSLFCLVVEKEDHLIGYATYMKQFSTWDAGYYIYMDCLFMTEESRGFGIGEKLMRRLKEEATALGCTLIQWQTPAFNKRAMKFYDRIGAIGKSKERYFLEIDADRQSRS